MILKSSALILLLAGAGTVYANPSDTRATGNPDSSATELSPKEWRAKRAGTVSAADLLRADVKSGPDLIGQPLGQVRDLILTADSKKVEYVLYEVPYPYSLYGSQNGFVAFDRVSVEDSDVGFGLRVQFEREEDGSAPEELELTRSQADHRLASRLLGDSVSFANEDRRTIEDILIDRATGKVVAFVVNRSPDALFNEEPGAIPAGNVSISERGDVKTGFAFADLKPVD